MLWFVRGAAIGMIGSPVLAALTALVFRFPVPFYGYASGPKTIVPALLGAVFYGVLGGFVVQAVLGGLGGVVGARKGWPDEKRMKRLCTVGSLVAAECGILALSVLDWIIGPW